ncbi:MAG: tyrosine-type recombinase/integrase [Proteobacteria bacterium]|nr:tyrosine-type recombinase/integrase [Pseudomonadota bacterium]MBS0461948.1 tyrosine-type recombinase/integrase [Pseudomonadota bacterium]MBS0463606.1 tyrosine-type recombinase/integrase [Pseudomonadota bacterium]
MSISPITPDTNSSLQRPNRAEPGCDRSLAFLKGNKHTYAANLISDWQAQLLHYNGLKPGSCRNHRDNCFRLLNHACVAPWELTKEHVIRYLESRVDSETGETLAPNTVGTYCAAWRSLQEYILEPERANEILREFKVRPRSFVTEENAIAVKRAKLNWKPKGWALSSEEIECIDATFRREITAAHRMHSKSLRPLMRDRVMFHFGIHFALRISELVAVRLSDFNFSHDATLDHFGRWGVLTVLGKNDVIGSVPLREPSIANLLEWYATSIRPGMILGRKLHEDAKPLRDPRGRVVSADELLFISERGGVICANAFRKRLADIAMKSGVLRRKLTPHVLRHTGCTLMLPLFSAEIAQKYMRHKGLRTTLDYYHPNVLQAANEVNCATALFDDDEE